MKNLTIAFQYNTLTFVDAACPRGDENMNDDDIAACFDMLAKGNDIRVACRQGMRGVVRHCMEHFIFVRAAGGVVREPQGKMLLIYRNQRWDLAKGGVEVGETLRRAAEREVMEETGMYDLTVGDLLIKTYHIYNLYGGWHLKQTSWFRMAVPHAYPIVAQQEEGITGGEWAPPDVFKERLRNSFATMRMVAERL